MTGWGSAQSRDRRRESPFLTDKGGQTADRVWAQTSLAGQGNRQKRAVHQAKLPGETSHLRIGTERQNWHRKRVWRAPASPEIPAPARLANWISRLALPRSRFAAPTTR